MTTDPIRTHTYRGTVDAQFGCRKDAQAWEDAVDAASEAWWEQNPEARERLLQAMQTQATTRIRFERTAMRETELKR